MALSPLQQLIVERIRTTGPLSFEQYMRIALYEPGYGYYVTGPAKMGWEGDYFTSVDVSDLFAHCVGRQLQQIWQQLGTPHTFTVVEQGSGRGNLSVGVRAWAQQHDPSFSNALNYRNEDITHGQNVIALPTQLPDVQLDETNIGHSGQVKDTDMVTVLLSNELVDAFPVHVVQKRANNLYEVYVDEQDGRLYEVLSEPENPYVARYLDGYDIPWRTFMEDWRAEINLDALVWMQNATRRLLDAQSTIHQPVYLLVIDYGDLAHDLYTEQRPYGTLNSYFQHQLTDRPLLRPGEQDITAHVNFSALIDEGRKQGFQQALFTTQGQWLNTMGIYEELEHIRQHELNAIDTARSTDRGQAALLAWYNLRQRVSTLTDPSGLGNFKVLLLKH
jgi:SAM-dependent MidA family methyltransferase